MDNQKIDIRKLSSALFILALAAFLLVIGKNFFTPLVFAFFFALVLTPVCRFYESKIRNRFVSILLSFLSVTIPFFLIVTLLASQFALALQDLPNIRNRVDVAINGLLDWSAGNLPFSQEEGLTWLKDNFNSVVGQVFQYLSAGLTQSTAVVAKIFLVLLYTFFFLWYRTGFRNFFIQQTSPVHRLRTEKMINNVQKVLQKYLTGLASIVLIVGIINSLGLWLIGIDYAFFWGFLASFLTVIPYIGTFIGGVLPLIYAIAICGTVWQPLAVAALFIGVQTLEGNFITPNVVGTSVNINPFVAILGLIIGGYAWGIEGMMLALPLLAILRVVFETNDLLRPAGFLMSSELYDHPHRFLDRWDAPKFRLSTFFRNRRD
jgi:predicted PurR-regulated permease PerM